jgi:magnesium transporter
MVVTSDERTTAGPSAASTEAVRAVLFDADGSDREIELESAALERVGKQQLLWVDVAAAGGEVEGGPWNSLGLDAAEVERALQPGERPRLETFDDFFHLTVFVIEERQSSYEAVELHAFAGENWIVTVHQPALALVDSFNGSLKGETELGALDGAVFLATLLNWLLNGYFHLVEHLEEDVDDLDERLLNKKKEVKEDHLLEELVAGRRHISRLRRLLAPHRDVFSMLAQPDSKVFTASESAEAFERLQERLEQAIGAVDQAREMLMGSFEVFMTQTTQRTNDIMKVLTVASVLLLPSIVIAGIMGMNFKVRLFDIPELFWVTITVMLALAATTLVVARWRKWI